MRRLLSVCPGSWPSMTCGYPRVQDLTIMTKILRMLFRDCTYNLAHSCTASARLCYLSVKELPYAVII